MPTANPPRNRTSEAVEALATLQPPNLPGAVCKGWPEPFEYVDRNPAVTAQARLAAIRLCLTCPALDGCRRYLAQFPPSLRPSDTVMAAKVTDSRGRVLRIDPATGQRATVCARRSRVRAAS